MDFGEFVGLVCRIDLVSSSKYFFHGKVIEADSDFIKLIDEKNRNVVLRVSDIKNIREDGK